MHAHTHGGLHVHDHGRAGASRALRWSLAFTVVYGLVQVGAGLAFNSLALVADAVHNLSDGAAIALALLATWAAGLPARGAHTYGWRRAEILAALVNGLALVAISGWIFWEAYGRISDPPDVAGAGVLVIGLVGVVANGIPVWLMLRASRGRDDLNLRGALIHAAADMLGSAGAALAGLIVLVTGWQAADPLIGAAIGLLILVSSFGLIRESLRILLEAAPTDLDPEEIGEAMAGVSGVAQVHDLHVWTITSGFPALSAHVVTRPDADRERLLHELQHLLTDRFGVAHSTLQLDREQPRLLQIHRPDCPEGPQQPGRRSGSEVTP